MIHLLKINVRDYASQRNLQTMCGKKYNMFSKFLKVVYLIYNDFLRSAFPMIMSFKLIQRKYYFYYNTFAL